MRVIFRTDSSAQIGTGHVMRCLTLAEALRNNGAKCEFICRTHLGNLIDQIRQRGYEVISLSMDPDKLPDNFAADEVGANYDSWLGTDWATDAYQTKFVITNMEVDWLIVDHYSIDVRWEKELRSSCRKLMVIDDLVNRKHDCDILLDQNLGKKAINYKGIVPNNCNILCGPSYAMLRSEFTILRNYSLRRRAAPQLKHLLISMGGIDSNNATGQILQSLIGCFFPKDNKITIVMGSRAPWLEQVLILAAKMPWPTEVKIDVQNMAELMANSDLAIGAAGSTSWERCCLGLPALIGVLANNQEPIADALNLAGAAMKFKDPTKINTMIKELTHDLTMLANMSARAAEITDGLGVKRVAAQILEI